MKNGASRYDAQYARMGGKPDIRRALQIFNVMSDYMVFHEQRIKTCAALNRSVDNPNWQLARRWSKRGRVK